MLALADFLGRLEDKIAEQLSGQRLGFLLGAGSSYLAANGYPLSSDLWNHIRDYIPEQQRREIQAKLDSGAQGIENALDLLDAGEAIEGPHRHLVTAAVSRVFAPITPLLEHHVSFLTKLSARPGPSIKVFTLNYDPLLERAAELGRLRLCDGFSGHEHAFFDPSMFEERIGRIRGTHKGRQFEETSRPIHLMKLHGSLGWYECPTRGIRRCSFSSDIPPSTKRLMIPPQRRKANDTMSPPYSALWSAFRGALGQDAAPLNRLATCGYGFLDEHVNAVIEAALARTDFTLLIFSMVLSDVAWLRWSSKPNVVIVTRDRSAIKGELGPGHPDLWNFERLAQKV